MPLPWKVLLYYVFLALSSFNTVAVLLPLSQYINVTKNHKPDKNFVQEAQNATHIAIFTLINLATIWTNDSKVTFLKAHPVLRTHVLMCVLDACLFRRATSSDNQTSRHLRISLALRGRLRLRPNERQLRILNTQPRVLRSMICEWGMWYWHKEVWKAGQKVWEGWKNRQETLVQYNLMH